MNLVGADSVFGSRTKEPKLVQKRLEYIALRHMNADITTADVEVSGCLTSTAFPEVLEGSSFEAVVLELEFNHVSCRGS